MRQQHKKATIVSAIMLFCIAGLRTAPEVLANVDIYPLPPGYRSDGRVSGTVDGRAIEFEYFRNFPTYYYDTNYCRFAADGPVDIVLNINTDFRQAWLRGLLRDISYEREGNRLRFTLPGPGHYYLQLPDVLYPIPGNDQSGTYTVAFWIDDINEIDANKMDPGDKDVLVVTKAGIVSDAERDQTTAVQALLDKGGRIYFPAGIYRTGTLNIRSDTEIYLSPGAILKASPRRNNMVSRFLYIENAARIRIHGPGTIDANYDGYPVDTPNFHILDVVDSHHIELEDACFRNCNSWAIHLFGSDQIRCHNIRVLSGKDGIDPDSASDVMIDGVYIQSKDDAVAVKTRKPPKPTERVTVRNSIVASDASALKVGTETRALMRDITFENCDVFDSDRGIILYARDGGPVENVTWRNIRLFMIYWPHETGGAPVQLFITRRYGLTPVRNLRIEHVNANIIAPCGFSGLANAPLTGATIRNLTLRVDPPKNSASYFRGNEDSFAPNLGRNQGDQTPDLFKINEHVELVIDGLTIDWQGHRREWGRIVPENPGMVNIRNLIQLN